MINGNEYKAQAINISYDSLMSQDSGKTDDGVSHIAYILSKIRVVNITLPPTTGDIISNILSIGPISDFNVTGSSLENMIYQDSRRQATD